MSVGCTAAPCPVILDSTCVFYSGGNLVYTGINTNDNLQTALIKINNKFKDAGLGYIFQNGIVQSAPGQPVKLGGSLMENTLITSGGFTFGLTGTIEASAFITTGGTSSEFVKGDGSLDSTSYQPTGNYITALTGDGVASGPGSSVFTLATVFGAPATYGSSSTVPVITVNAKGLITSVSITPINYPTQSIAFSGDVYGSGYTGSSTVLTISNVNPNVYATNTVLKFAVNNKGLITSAAPITNLDLDAIYGYTPIGDAPFDGTTYGRRNHAWVAVTSSPGTVTSVGVTSGTGISASVANPTTTPVITITNTAPDQTVVLNNGTGISVTGTYPNFTIAATSVGSVTAVSASLPLTSSGGATPNISTSMATNKLIGRGTAGTGVFEEITLGSGLSLTGTTLNSSAVVTPAALTKTDDTNVTLTLGGSPTTALLQATSLTLGWTGTLADSRIASATTWNGKQNALSGTGVVKSTAGLISYISGTSAQYIAGDGSLVTFPTIPTVGTWGALNYPTWTSGTPFVKMTAVGTFALDTNTYLTSAVTSVGLTMPSAFNVASSPVTGAGTIAVTGAGLVSQYIRGDGTLANFPISTGGGSSVSYYLNGSVNQGVFSGNTYYEMNGTPVIGAGTDFTINANGYIAQFITDTSDPNKLLIPAGNWNFETYFNASSNGGSPSFYIELYKYDGATFTLIASSSATPENITGGTSIDLYYTALAVPSTVLLATDRLAVRFYVTHSGRTIKMHTEDSHLSQIITTFSTGLTALNGLTAQVQNFANDTNVTMVSSGSTHTITWAGTLADSRIASASTWNAKIGGSGTTNELAYFTAASTIGSLTTATYPSLTELSYVKGVTSAVQTQLGTKQDISLSAYTFRANNTNATANATDNTFKSIAQQTYTGTIVWTGTTAPSGTTNHTYQWSQIGKLVSLRINLDYATVGAALTQVLMNLPSDCPSPIVPTNVGATNVIVYGSGAINGGKTAAISSTSYAALRVNAAATGYELIVNRGSSAYQYAYINIQYFA